MQYPIFLVFNTLEFKPQCPKFIRRNSWSARAANYLKVILVMCIVIFWYFYFFLWEMPKSGSHWLIQYSFCLVQPSPSFSKCLGFIRFCSLLVGFPCSSPSFPLWCSIIQLRKWSAESCSSWNSINPIQFLTSHIEYILLNLSGRCMHQGILNVELPFLFLISTFLLVFIYKHAKRYSEKNGEIVCNASTKYGSSVNVARFKAAQHKKSACIPKQLWQYARP